MLFESLHVVLEGNAILVPLMVLITFVSSVNTTRCNSSQALILHQHAPERAGPYVANQARRNVRSCITIFCFPLNRNDLI